MGFRMGFVHLGFCIEIPSIPSIRYPERKEKMSRKPKKAYVAEFKRFMAFLDMSENPSTEDLLAIPPNDLCRYLDVKAYGTDDPEEDEHFPVCARRNAKRT